MKHVLTLICLLAVLSLAACGFQTPAKDPAPSPEPPVSTEAPIAVNAAAQPDEIPAQPAETPAPAAPQETPAPAPVPETPAPAPVVVEQTVQPPVSAAAQSASKPFTGVMGTVFTVPESFIQLDESPNIGYQYTFWHPDHEVRIEVREIAPGYLPDGAFQNDRDAASADPNVTYFKEGENWFVKSGYLNDGQMIFYDKETSSEGALKSFHITYPTAKRDYGDAVTAEFEKNFSF